jgi:hypothetical protein
MANGSSASPARGTLLGMSDVTGVSADHTDTAAQRKVDPTYAWAIALLPFGLLPFLTAINSDVVTVTLLLGLASTVFARGDSKKLATVGVSLSPAWALLAGFTYLVSATPEN